MFKAAGLLKEWRRKWAAYLPKPTNITLVELDNSCYFVQFINGIRQFAAVLEFMLQFPFVLAISE